MTRFERDLRDVREYRDTLCLMKRKEELENLWNELKGCKNSFRASILAQRISELQKEYEQLDSLF